MTKSKHQQIKSYFLFFSEIFSDGRQLYGFIQALEKTERQEVYRPPAGNEAQIMDKCFAQESRMGFDIQEKLCQLWAGFKFLSLKENQDYLHRNCASGFFLEVQSKK